MIHLALNQPLYVYIGNGNAGSAGGQMFNGGGAKATTNEGNSRSGGGATDFRLLDNDDIKYTNK
jgi:hypothetical protein